MRLKRINHVGIVPKNFQVCKDFFQNILQMENVGNEVVKSQKVETEMFQIENSTIELLAPTSDESPIAKYLSTKGAGIHHIAIEVEDIHEALADLTKKNVKLIDSIPREGAHNTRVAFIHPHATGGILIEIVQKIIP